MGKIKYPLGILLTMIIGALLNMFLCCNCWGDNNALDNDKSTPIADEKPEQSGNSNVAATTMSYLILKDQTGNLVENGTDHLNFKLNDYKHLEPVNTNAITSYENIKTYLSNHPDKKFNITGLYGSDEINNSAFTNLGEARANDAKNYLASLGYDTTHMGIKGKLSDDMDNRNGILYGPLNYSLSDRC